MSAAERAIEPAALFAALGDRTRLALMMTLRDGEARSIATLSIDAAITRQAVTKHLRVLEDAGLVRSSRAGRESRYAARREGIAAAQAFLDQVAAGWDDALARLKAHVE